MIGWLFVYDNKRAGERATSYVIRDGVAIFIEELNTIIGDVEVKLHIDGISRDGERRGQSYKPDQPVCIRA